LVEKMDMNTTKRILTEKNQNSTRGAKVNRGFYGR